MSVSVRRKSTQAAVCCLICATLGWKATAQPTLDNNFNPTPNGRVSTIAVQSDGKVVFGGAFTSVNGVSRSYLARLNADGSLDNGFPASGGPAQYVSRVVVRDSKIYVAAGDGLSRFDLNGTREWQYPISVGAFDVDSQGRVLFGGQFVRVENQYHRNIARLDATGLLDPTFAPAIGCCAGEGVNALMATSGDSVLSGGMFQSVNGTPVLHLARIGSDGSLDTSFQAGADAPVLALAPTPDGKIVRVSEQTVARHLASGALDSSFAPRSAGGSSDDRFLTAAVQAGGNVIVGGNFTSDGGASRCYVARLNTSGGWDASFAIQPNDTVAAIATAADGSVLIGGSFTEVNGVPHAGIARVQTSTSAPPVLNIAAGLGANGIVLSWPALGECVLESIALNESAWTKVSASSVTVGGKVYVTNSVAGIGRLFRLRMAH